mgnify:CR=1 FL=1
MRWPDKMDGNIPQASMEAETTAPSRFGRAGALLRVKHARLAGGLLAALVLILLTALPVFAIENPRKIDWDNLQRADCPKVRAGLTHVELETVGFKLKDYRNFLHSISRLLVRWRVVAF